VKRAGGRRYYRPRDVELVMACAICSMTGYTIKGVQRILKEQGARAVVESLRAGRFQPGFAAAPDEVARQDDVQDDALAESAVASRHMEPPDLPPAQERAFAPEAEALAPLVVRPDAPPPMQLPTVAGPCAKPRVWRGRRAPLAARSGRSRRVPPPAVAHIEMKRAAAVATRARPTIRRQVGV